MTHIPCTFILGDFERHTTVWVELPEPGGNLVGLHVNVSLGVLGDLVLEVPADELAAAIGRRE